MILSTHGVIASQIQSYAFLLDTYTSAAAAYSLRKLRSAYTGSAIRVRRSSDNTETDIGFSSEFGLDTTALSSFCGSGNGFVTTWYDQSGNGRNATQATAVNQPQIVSSGTVLLQGSKPIMQFLGSDFLRTVSTFSMGVNRSYTMTLFSAINSNISFKGYLTHTATNYSDNTLNGMLGRFDNSKFPVSYVSNGSTNTNVGNTPLTDNQYYLLNQLVQGSVQHQMYRNGVLNAQNTSLAISPENTARSLDVLFTAQTGNDLRTNEAIVWESYQSSNRTGIESNINTYYAIY
jgi:hypothetical protein